MEFPAALCPYQYLTLSIFLILIILVSMQWYFIGALICMPWLLMMLNTYMCLLETTLSIYLPTYLYNVFFKSVACFYIILMVSSISKKRKSDLSIFFLYGIDFKSCLRKLLWTRSQKYCPMFFFRSLIITDFIFKSMIHLKLNLFNI